MADGLRLKTIISSFLITSGALVAACDRKDAISHPAPAQPFVSDVTEEGLQSCNTTEASCSSNTQPALTP